MMLLPAMANGAGTTAKPASISSQATERAGTAHGASFTESTAQAASSGDGGESNQAQLESTPLAQESQSSAAPFASELSAEAELLSEAQPAVSDSVADDPLTTDSLTPLLAAEQAATESDTSSVPAELEEALAEPATQLWHWHYSRSARIDQATVEQATAKPMTTEQVASLPTGAAADLAASDLAATELATSYALTEQSRADQGMASRVATNERVAERRLSLASAFAEPSNGPVTQLAGNKLLLQQLASGAMAPIKMEEINNSLTSGGAASAVQGRAGVPVHEWAPVVVDATNKAQLGAQLLQTLKDKVELQLNQEVQQARIKLDPPEMGRLELSIRLEGDKLHIHITASHAGVRDALNAHADRLRSDLLPQHGGGVEVSVGQGNASSQEESQSDAPREGQNMISSADREAAALEQQGVALRGWINTLV